MWAQTVGKVLFTAVSYRHSEHRLWERLYYRAAFKGTPTDRPTLLWRHLMWAQAVGKILLQLGI